MRIQWLMCIVVRVGLLIRPPVTLAVDEVAPFTLSLALEKPDSSGIVHHGGGASGIAVLAASRRGFGSGSGAAYAEEYGGEQEADHGRPHEAEVVFS